MKYIKLFENIDWDEEWEEEDPDLYKDYPEDLKKFLIRYDVLEEFHKNIINKGNNIKEYCDRTPKIHWILFTLQSKQNWVELNRKWMEPY